jgi:hypothetical protein
MDGNTICNYNSTKCMSGVVRSLSCELKSIVCSPINIILHEKTCLVNLTISEHPNIPFRKTIAWEMSRTGCLTNNQLILIETGEATTSNLQYYVHILLPFSYLFLSYYHLYFQVGNLLPTIHFYPKKKPFLSYQHKRGNQVKHFSTCCRWISTYAIFRKISTEWFQPFLVLST